MSDYQNLQTLFDFSDLKNQKGLTHSSSSNLHEDTSENETILRSFKQLRQKLKLAQKQNSQLRQQIKIHQIRLRQSQQSLQLVMSSNIEVKDQLNTQRQANQQLKKRLVQMKETLARFASVQQELQFTKDSLLQAKLVEKSFLQQRNKIMELSIGEKMKLQQEVTRLLVKSKSDEGFIISLETELAKAKEITIKLQNQIRKINITYDQQTFSNKWTRQNFETQHLTETIRQLQIQIGVLKGKNSKQKQKRCQLQEKLIQLEQQSGVNQVRASIFQGQTSLITKKQQKSTRKLSELNIKVSQKNEQKLALEEKLTKISLFSESFLQKLKMQKCAGNLSELISQFQSNLKVFKQYDFKLSKNQNAYASNKSSAGYGSVLQQQKQFNSIHCHISNKYQSNVALKDNKFSVLAVQGGMTSRFTFGFEKQNQRGEISGLQTKVRKQREQMEKRIREKYMHKKLEASLPSQVHKLRGQYIRSFVDKR